jgi:hypothetical protein
MSRTVPSARPTPRYYSESVQLAGEQVPREMVGEVSCQAATLREALEASASAVLVTAHVMSFIANAFVGNPEIELGFDATPSVTERE